MPPRVAVKTEPMDARQTLRDVAYGRLRQLLILSQLTRGNRLREPEWATRLGVNRAALREAFARLEAEGLLVRGVKTGYFVPELTDADIAEIVKVRLALEKTAVEEICAAKGEIKLRLRPLREALGEFEALAPRRYVLGTIEADRRFHEALVSAAGLRLLSMLYQRAPLPMISRSIASQEEWDASATATITEHGAILAALEGRDAAKAKRLLESHLRHASLLPLGP
jgi:DNA-binding GntR family transcriptional regulator